MPNPPTLTISPLPTERLNKIAIGKLAALGVPVKTAAGQQTLAGELTFTSGKILHPSTRTPILRGAFVVVGHDHLLFSASPLSALGPVMFFDAPTLVALEERIAATLSKRLLVVSAHADRMKKLRLTCQVDSEKLEVVAGLKIVPDVIELRAGLQGVWVSRITSANATVCTLAPQSALIDLAQFQTLIDLELHLSDLLPSLLARAAQEAARPVQPVEVKPSRAGLEALAAPPDALTLAVLTKRLGADAVFGLDSPGEITQQFRVGTVTWRFSATHLGGARFKGRLRGPAGEKWADTFDLLRFPGIPSLVSTVLGVDALSPTSPAAPAPGGATGTGPAPSSLDPQVGEVWVMNVIIEREDQDEVRYACTNIDGKPFGATRVLKGAEFREVFVQAGIGWRLLIQMEEVGADGSVVYRQLDSQRQPRGSSKRLAASILVTNFVPEATAY